MKIKFKRELSYLSFAMPAFLVYTILTIYPLAQTLWLSFTNWDGYSMENLSFVGFQNFENIFSDKAMVTALWNTCFYSIVFPILVTVFAIPLAIILNSRMSTRNFQRAVFFFPSVPSTIILGYLWPYILVPTQSGVLNQFLGLFGIRPVLWLADPKWAMVSVIMVGMWSSMGWHACIYLAKLQSIPTDYYEAAIIDGANSWQKFKYFTLEILL